jgi:acyl dehydratase
MPRKFDARTERFGHLYEDFEIGDIYIHWPGKTITEAENNHFCLMTMASSPLHVDSNFAKTEMPEGKNLVVGTYIYALLTGMSVADISGAAIASLEVRNLKHLQPFYPGDTLYGETTILSKRISQSKPDRGLVTVSTAGFNQNKTLVCTFERTFLVPIRGSN